LLDSASEGESAWSDDGLEVESVLSDSDSDDSIADDEESKAFYEWLLEDDKASDLPDQHQTDVSHETDNVSQYNLNSELFHRDPGEYDGIHEERVLKLISAEKLELLTLARGQVDTIKLGLPTMPKRRYSL
jgi:hypothetical protein